MKHSKPLLGAVAVAFILAGCASEPKGPPLQKIQIDALASNRIGAAEVNVQCDISNDRMGFDFFMTGGNVQVPASNQKIVVDCRSSKYGFARATILPDAQGVYPTWVRLRFGYDLVFDRAGQASTKKPARGRLAADVAIQQDSEDD